MAHFYEPTPEQIDEYNKWVSERPPHVKVVAERFNPWTLYKLTSTG